MLVPAPRFHLRLQQNVGSVAFRERCMAVFAGNGGSDRSCGSDVMLHFTRRLPSSTAGCTHMLCRTAPGRCGVWRPAERRNENQWTQNRFDVPKVRHCERRGLAAGYGIA